VIDRLAGLNQGHDLEQLVERAVAAGQGDDRARVAHEHQLADEEVLERQRHVAIRVQRLLVREDDVEADGGRADVLRTAVRGLHQARAAARDHGEPRVADRPADLAGALVERVVDRRARGAEDADGVTDVGEGLEAGAQLGLDQRKALRIGARGDDRGPLGADDLLAERGG